MIHLLLALAFQCPDGSPPPCRGGARAGAPATSLAVLYFDNASSDSTDAYLADGITEEIISRLGEIGRLQVKSRYLVRRYRGGAEHNPADIGRQLSVASIVTGSVRRAGNRVRVTAEMVRASTGDVVWSDRYDRATTDILSLEGDLAASVATAVAGRLLPSERQAVSAAPTTSTAAYDAYLLGRFHWGKRTAADLVRAAEYFQQAIRADSNFAQAWSGLADSYVLFVPSEYGVQGVNYDSILTLAEAAARRAVALAPRLGEAWTSLGEIVDDRGRAEEATRAFEQGVTLSPQYATAHQWYSYHLMGLGRWDEATHQSEVARELDPSSLVITATVVFAYDGAGRSADADATAEQCHALDPTHNLTLQFCDFLHDVSARHLDRVPGDLRRLDESLGTDSATTVAQHPFVGLALCLAYASDDAALAFLDRVAGTPRAALLPNWLLLGILGPQRRADPRFQAAVTRLGYHG